MPTQGTNGFDVNDELGCDLLWGDDLDPTHRLESGVDLLRHDIFGRITCPHGRLIDDPDYGLDVVSELLSVPLTKTGLAQFPRRLENEIRKDPRVKTVTVSMSQTDTYAFRIDVRGTSAVGPFRLTVDVSQALARIVENS